MEQTTELDGTDYETEDQHTFFSIYSSTQAPELQMGLDKKVQPKVRKYNRA